jgi:excisionase family DNA binding protein
MEALMDVEDLAAYLKQKKQRVYNNHAWLGIPSIKVGNSIRFKPSAVEKWVEWVEERSSDYGGWR